MPTEITPSTYWLNKDVPNDPVIVTGTDGQITARSVRHPCKEGSARTPMSHEGFLTAFRPLVPTELLELAKRSLSEAWGQPDPEVAWYQGVKSAEHMIEAAVKDMEGFEQPRLFFTEKDIEGLRWLIEISQAMGQYDIYAGIKVSDAINGGRALLGRLEELKGSKDEFEQAVEHIRALLRREDVSESDHQTDIKGAQEFIGRVGL